MTTENSIPIPGKSKVYSLFNFMCSLIGSLVCVLMFNMFYTYTNFDSSSFQTFIVVTLAMLAVTVLANRNAYNFGINENITFNNIFRLCNNLLLMILTVYVMIGHFTITVNEHPIAGSYLQLIKITFCFAVVNSIIGHIAGMKKREEVTPISVVEPLREQPVVKTEKIKPTVTESIKKSFRLEFPPIDELFDPQTQIIENRDNVYESVEILLDDNDDTRSEFIQRVKLSEKGSIYLEEREEEGHYCENFNLPPKLLDSVIYNLAQIHDMCKRYKNGEDIFPHDVKAITLTKYPEDRQYDCGLVTFFPYWEIRLKFENKKVQMEIIFSCVDDDEP